MPTSTKRPITDLRGLWRSELQNHFLVQSEMAKSNPKQNVIVEFLTTKVWGWLKHYFKSRFMGKVAYQFYPTKDDDGIYPLTKLETDNSPLVVTLAADWASNTQESDDVGTLMDNENPDYSIHLGDVYYVGLENEINDNFGPQGSWPRGKLGTLAIPGNHEYYSNGKDFYETLLSKYTRVVKSTGPDVVVAQQAGFFCLENEHWRIIALDTGYTSVGTPIIEFLFQPNCELRDEQVNWLREVVKLGDETDKRGLVILSHHQYFSGFEGNYPRPAQQLAEIMGNAQRDVLWYWGHEHRLAIYNLHQLENGIPAYGRCIGHGGMPVDIPTGEHPLDVEKAQEHSLLYYDRQYRRVLDGKKEVFLGNNGYVKLTFDGPTLRADHYQAWRDETRHQVERVLVLTELITTDTQGNVTVQYQNSALSEL
ncbi:MAG: metallophosphoesterase [Spirosomataceae bacterium]